MLIGNSAIRVVFGRGGERDVNSVEVERKKRENRASERIERTSIQPTLFFVVEHTFLRRRAKKSNTMLRCLSLLLALCLGLCAHAAEPDKLRSIAEGLTRTKGAFVFQSLPKPSNTSTFDSVEVSARTETGLRLEGTAMRSLGVSLRGWKIGPW